MAYQHIIPTDDSLYIGLDNQNPNNIVLGAAFKPETINVNCKKLV